MILQFLTLSLSGCIFYFIMIFSPFSSPLSYRLFIYLFILHHYTCIHYGFCCTFLLE